MARALRIQFPGAFYHITCRGNERKRIFEDDDDRYRFLALLTESLEAYQVVLHGYILMSNHFHLLVQTLRGNLSEFMRRFNICYTGWFNHHHGRCGHLYQGRYKALLVDADSYLLEVSRYLHLNCVRGGMTQHGDYRERWRYAQEYRWSSLPGYVHKKKITDFVSYDMLLSMSSGRRAYRAFVIDGLKKGVEDLFENIKYQVFLGNDDFVARVRSEHLEQGSAREQPSYRGLVAELVEPEVVLGIVAEVMEIDRTRLSVRLGPGVARGIAAELLHRYSGLTQVEIGALLGDIDYCSVSQLRRRLKMKMGNDRIARNCYSEATDKVKAACQV